jgi:hypothetical protein
MSNEVKDAGFKAGTEGKTENDNPHSSGPGGRMADVLSDIIIPGGGAVERSDQAAKDWNDARAAGEASQKGNK